MYDGHSLLDVLLTSTLPLLVFRGVLSLRAEKIRFWRLEHEDARVKTPFVWWRHRPTAKKRSFFTTDITSIGTLMLSKGPWAWWMILHSTADTSSVRLPERTPSMFAISDKHSGRLLNFLCCFLYLELGLSWVIHAWTSDFKLFQQNWNLELSLGRGICAQF